VDRVVDDYPVLVAPGQPMLRANITVEEMLKYSPRRMDVINLETNSFETVEVKEILRTCGTRYPQIRQLVSLVDHDRVEQPVGLMPDLEKTDAVFTFEGLIRKSPFVSYVRELLALLQARLGCPVDIEFAYDNSDFYLLQCRPQCYSGDAVPVAIPQDIPANRVIFSATRYVSNGKVPDITHIVYVDPEGYGHLPDQNAMRDVGRAVGRLNKLLPKRRFILIGPGRWGSRGDIKLGVPVTYSDINNSAMLIEVARQKGNYLPELSFGTHFFQDLVEASVRYLPLYPDDEGTVFQEDFLRNSRSVLHDILPEFSHLSGTLRVIDIAKETNGNTLRVLMNADLDQAVAFLAPPQKETERVQTEVTTSGRPGEEHSRWRYRMAQGIAQQLDPAKFGVKAFYIIGSTKNATAGPQSDIDLLIHFEGLEEQRRDLLLWLEGWSRCLAEMNFFRTGYRCDGLLDVHLITDIDIAQRSPYAVKIGAITDAARELPIGSLHSGEVLR
jgi:hypothetical protein